MPDIGATKGRSAPIAAPQRMKQRNTYWAKMMPMIGQTGAVLTVSTVLIDAGIRSQQFAFYIGNDFLNTYNTIH